MAPEANSQEAHLTHLIVTLADKGEEREKRIIEVSEIIADQFLSHSSLISNLIAHCVGEMASKSREYGALVGLINRINNDVAREILLHIFSFLGSAFLLGHWVQAKLIIRFLGELSNFKVITKSGYLDLLSQLLEEAKEPNIPPSRADYFVSIVISALPWCGKEIFTEGGGKAEEVTQDISFHMLHRKRRNYDVIKIIRGDSLLEPQEFIEYLWKNVQSMAENDWQLDLFPKYEKILEMVKNAEPQEIKPLQIAPHSGERTYPLSFLTFRIFQSLDNEAMKFSAVERAIMTDIVLDHIWMYEVNHRECIKTFSSFPLAKNIPLDYVIVEVLFNKIFQLPEPEINRFYYYSLLVNLSRSSSEVSIIIGKVVEMLYSQKGKMELPLVHRFADWMAIYLSHFDFSWNWLIWKDEIDEEKHPENRIFIREVLTNCIRLSYYERIEKTVPEEMTSLLPSPFLPSFKYIDHPIAKELVEQMGKKKGNAEILGLLSEGKGDMRLEGKDEQLSFFSSALLHASSPSFSHFMANAQRYIGIFQDLCKTKESQRTILDSVFSYWKSSPQHKVLVTEKLMALRIIEADSLLSFLFSDYVISDYSCGYVWELMEKGIDKVLSKVDAKMADLMAEEKFAQEIQETGGDPLTRSRQEERVEKLRVIFERGKKEERDLFLLLFSLFQHTLDNKLRASDPSFLPLFAYFRHFGRKYAERQRKTNEGKEIVPQDSSSRVLAVANEIRSLSSYF